MNKLRLRILLLVALFSVCLSGALWRSYDQHRQRASVAPVELWEVVWRQVLAVRESDFAGAYQQASLSFQERYDLDAFTDLARSEYPALRMAERVECGAVRWDGQYAIVPTYFFLPEGEVLPCLYCLVCEENVWKIDAMRVQRRWPAGRRLGGMRT